MIKNNKIFKILKNKYLWSSLLFIIWMLFFDTNSLILHWKFNKYKHQLIIDRNYLKRKIIIEGNYLKQLTTNQKFLEKFAREKFFMKKDDEDLFLLKKIN
ncbi:septum formation initiator family protein [Blattabacterium cuenoti]|uniref:septum formation initiator family protein n=1 Tax=Blattabacterium cuenoti TaxID=1653831 RepID=UPI001EEA9C00|nr:septum formation initiator family protein [Blattabacterium cuenoti]